MILRDIVESLAIHGIRKIIILNAHGGNVRALQDHLEEIKNGQPIDLLFYSYWQAADPEFITKIFAYPEDYPGHAGEFETSFAMAAFPENVDLNTTYPSDLIIDPIIKDPQLKKRDYKMFTGAHTASPEKGKAFIAHITPRLIEKIRTFI